jgi:hypothetical protein
MALARGCPPRAEGGGSSSNSGGSGFDSRRASRLARRKAVRGNRSSAGRALRLRQPLVRQRAEGRRLSTWDREVAGSNPAGSPCSERNTPHRRRAGRAQPVIAPTPPGNKRPRGRCGPSSARAGAAIHTGGRRVVAVFGYRIPFTDGSPGNWRPRSERRHLIRLPSASCRRRGRSRGACAFRAQAALVILRPATPKSRHGQSVAGRRICGRLARNSRPWRSDVIDPSRCGRRSTPWTQRGRAQDDETRVRANARRIVGPALTTEERASGRSRFGYRLQRNPIGDSSSGSPFTPRRARAEPHGLSLQNRL